MQESSRLSNNERPESFVQRLAARLSRHLLWDSLLIFLPPVAALAFAMAMLFWASWLSPIAALLAAALALGLALLAVGLRQRLRMPSLSSAARLADQKARAPDHFLTLATVDPANQSASLLARLRQQSSGYLGRIEFKRDFPYRFKRSAYWSAGASLLAVLLLYFFMPVAQSARRPLSQRLHDTAREMAKKPDFEGLAKEIEALAVKLDDPQTSAEEKQALIQKLEEKIAEQQKKQEQQENRDLLGQAASALGGTEQQQAASGEERKKDQKDGGGGLHSNAQQQGRRESKPSQGGSGESKGETTAQLNPDMDQGKSAQGDPKGQGEDKNRQGDGEKDRSDPNQPGKDSPEKAGQTEGGSKEGAGKEQKAAEAPPQGGPPAERFYRPGEGKGGLKGARYVTVQLPEDVIADAKGETRAAGESKNRRTKTRVPVSNVPLPAHVPDAPTEKQPFPLEYRGIIR